MLVETLVPQSLPAREAVPLVTNLELLRGPAIAYLAVAGVYQTLLGDGDVEGLDVVPMHAHECVCLCSR
jgi:hypothetical protein